VRRSHVWASAVTLSRRARQRRGATWRAALDARWQGAGRMEPAGLLSRYRSHQAFAGKLTSMSSGVALPFSPAGLTIRKYDRGRVTHEVRLW
jgi:hypothetical protein